MTSVNPLSLPANQNGLGKCSNSSLVYITTIMDSNMDFEQGGSVDALAIFQEAYNAQQRPTPPVGPDHKMLYVHLSFAH